MTTDEEFYSNIDIAYDLGVVEGFQAGLKRGAEIAGNERVTDFAQQALRDNIEQAILREMDGD